MTPQPERSRAVVRPAAAADMRLTARMHQDHLRHGLFPLLGDAFMRRWHGTYLCAPAGVALVAVRTEGAEERLVGFLVGSTDQTALVQHVVREHRFRLGASGLRALLVRPRLGLHFLRTRASAYLRRLLSRPVRPEAADASSTGRPDAPHGHGRRRPVAVVTALVVLPEARGQGAGEALVAGFVDLVRRAGTPEAHLTTLDGPDGAGAFYESLGWSRRDVHPTRDGLQMATYRLVPAPAGPLGPPPPTPAEVPVDLRDTVVRPGDAAQAPDRRRG